VLITVFLLIFKTRAVSRIPLPLITISTTCSFTDFYICPEGKILNLISSTEKKVLIDARSAQNVLQSQSVLKKPNRNSYIEGNMNTLLRKTG